MVCITVICYLSNFFLGNIYIADSGNHRIRKVTVSTGIITTIAGTGEYGYSGDGDLAMSAQFRNPFSVAVDSSGRKLILLYITSSFIIIYS